MNAMNYWHILFSNCLVLILSNEAVRDNGILLEVTGEAHGGYFISVNVGTPAQTAILLIDSGSSSFAISINNQLTNSSFEYEKSKTFSKTDDKVSVHYTEGSWSGFIASDNLSLCSNPICNMRMQFACITSAKDLFGNSTVWSGILGLSYAALSKPDNAAQPFLETLTATGIPNIFSLSLCGPIFHSRITSTVEGKLLLGYTDDHYYTGEIVYTPVVKEWFYEVMLTNLKVGDSQFNSSCSTLNNDKSIIDTGSSFLSFPKEIHDWIVGEIKKQVPTLPKRFTEEFWKQKGEVCIVDISIYKLFPKIILSFYHTSDSSFSLVIPPELYILKFPDDGGLETCLLFAISSTEKGTVIGATVLKGFYVVFDREGQRIGFANSSCTENVETSPVLQSVVQKPHFVSEKDLQCKYIEPIPSSTIAALIIIFTLSLPFAYVFGRWAYRFFIKLE